MKKQEVIEKLKQYVAWCTECHDINGVKDRYVKVAKVRELIEQIEEPKQVKPVVKQFVADWFEENKQALEGNIYSVPIVIWEKGEQTDFEKWFNDSGTKPFETLIKMKLFGYTVEQPKQWVVRHEAGKFFEKFTGNGTNRAWVVWKNQAYVFTDKSKAEAVAVLVEGSVEEV